MLWAYGRLWVGTASNASTGKVSWIRPDIDTSFTTDLTLAAGEAAVPSMAIFQGQIYAGVLNRTLGPGSVKLKVRSTVGAWSDSDTGTLDTTAGNIRWRGYWDVYVWPPENSGITSPTPAIYAVRQGCTADTNNNLGIRKSTGGAWSTVRTEDTIGFPLVGTFAQNSGTISPVLWSVKDTHAFNTTNGSAWTDRSSNFTLSGETFIVPQIVVQT